MEYYSNIKQNATPVEGVDLANKKYVDNAIQANAIGKETVLYEGNITAEGTYTLTDDVNNYDLIVINHGLNGVQIQSLTVTKAEIKRNNSSYPFTCIHGNGNADYYIKGYFIDDKVIITARVNQSITSITGYKFGEVTVQNTITNPLQPISYSTDEQLTGGTWIDGKPIYRKVFDYSSSLWGSENGDKDISNLNIKQIISSYFIGANNANGTSNQWAQGVISDCDRVLYFNEKYTVMKRLGSFYYKYVILEYTKTTDV